jgi:hypothetical protein
LAAQGHLSNDFLLAGDLSLAFGDVSISFRNVVTLDVCLPPRAATAGASERPALSAKS